MPVYPRLVPMIVHVRAMNIHHADTLLGRGDPLKQLFKNLFAILPSGVRGHVVAVIGEFIGTLLFIFLALSGIEVAGASSNQNQGDQVSTGTPQHSPQQLLYTALSVGFSFAVMAWVFFRISGGLFNPVVRYFVRLFHC